MELVDHYRQRECRRSYWTIIGRVSGVSGPFIGRVSANGCSGPL